MFCHFCGKEIDDNAKFCVHCGENLDSVKEVTQNTVVKEKKPIITKATIITTGLCLLLLVLYAGIAFLLIQLLHADDTILIKSSFDDDLVKTLTLKEFLDILLDGNRIFNPTMLSTSIGLGLSLFIYATPAFAALAFISACIGKKTAAINTVFSIMSILSAIAVAIVTPISVKLVSELKLALAYNQRMLSEDIKAFSYAKPIVYSAIVMVLVIVTGIVTRILNKRRAISC